MRTNRSKVTLFLVMMASLFAATQFAAAEVQTITGVIKEVQKGSEYSLTVGDASYKLVSSDQKVLSQLGTLAGKRAEITGTVTDDTIQVTLVAVAYGKKW